jgi:SSS family solute:Na+ symporter
VQRCLGARSEWDARMGVVFAGFMKILLPLLVVIPGIVAFKLYPGLADKDQAFPTLVRELVPAGLSGIVIAGLASGMLSHISSVLNSCSTVFTMDLYKPGLGRHKSDAHLVRVGRASGFVILLVATLLALWFTRRKLGVFDLLQNIGAWVAAPIAAVFLLGVLWRRATATAATCVLVFAFPYTALVEYVLFKRVPWLMPFDNWLNRTFLVWATSMLAMVVISLVTAPPDPKKIAGIIWTWRVAALPESERERNRGFRNLLLWYGLFIAAMAALYIYVIWFQFWGPGKDL